MKAVITITCALVILGPCDPLGLAQEKPTPQPALTKMPAGVRELTFDIQKCGRHKKGPSVAVCTTREQLDLELGGEVAKAVWAEMDPKQEVAVVLGIWDTLQSPVYDGFIIREIKAEGSTTLRFKYNRRNEHEPFTFLLGFEWPTRCKVYAVPRGAAVGLD